MPNSNTVFLLDFKKKLFVKEQIQSALFFPMYFSSIQLETGNIFVMGGIDSDKIVTNRVFEINDSLQMRTVNRMKVPRYSFAVALLRENYILVAGGCVQTVDNKKQFTN